MSDENILELREENEKMKQRVQQLLGQNNDLDKNNRDLEERLKAQETEGTKSKTAKKADDLELQLAAKEREIDRRERVLKMAMDKGIDPQTAFSLLGINGNEETALDALVEFKSNVEQTTTDRLLRENGRNPLRGLKMSTGGRSLAEINALSDDEIMRLPGDTISRAIKEYEQKQRGGTAGNAMRDRIFGGGS